jgi:hypothetical protein
MLLRVFYYFYMFSNMFCYNLSVSTASYIHNKHTDDSPQYHINLDITLCVEVCILQLTS